MMKREKERSREKEKRTREGSKRSDSRSGRSGKTDTEEKTGNDGRKKRKEQNNAHRKVTYVIGNDGNGDAVTGWRVDGRGENEGEEVTATRLHND